MLELWNDLAPIHQALMLAVVIEVATHALDMVFSAVRLKCRRFFRMKRRGAAQ